MEESEKQKSTKKEQPEKFISDQEKDLIVFSALKSRARLISDVTKEVDKVVKWINEQYERLKYDPNFQASLTLDLDYNDTTSVMAADAILAMLGTRLLQEKERNDSSHPVTAGIKSTNKTSTYLYSEHLRPQVEGPIEERYTLIISHQMALPANIQSRLTTGQLEGVQPTATTPPTTAPEPEKIEQKIAPQPQTNLPKTSIPPRPEITEEKLERDHQERTKPKGFFELLNDVLIGDDEEEY